MTKSKFLHRLFILFFMGCTMCALQGCSENSEEEILSELVGAWYGYGKEDNTSAEATITFNSNGTGFAKFNYWKGGFSKEKRCHFTYSVEGKNVLCEGYETSVNSYGDVETESWSNTFTYSKGKLKGGDYGALLGSYRKN